MTETYSPHWDLKSLFPEPTTPEFSEVVQKYRSELEHLADRSDHLPVIELTAGPISLWILFLQDWERIETRAIDLRAVIECYAAGDATNKSYLQTIAKLAAIDPLRERITTNLEFALKALPEETFAEFLKTAPELSRIAYYLKLRREQASFRLPKEQELLAADLGVDGIHAWGRLYDRLCGELRVPIQEKGEIVQKSVSQIRFDMADRPTRENNYFAADKAWAGLQETCADALNHIAGTRLTLYKRLGLKDHLDLPLRHNRMQRQTLETMWSAITARKGMLLKYFERKAQALGVSKLAWFDQQAPYPVAMAAGASQEISYTQAMHHIEETFTGFSPDFGDFAKMAAQSGWIEAENRPGKRQGAFCTGIPGCQQSRVFMTFTGSEDSMSTLAHELGHAYHSYVLRDQPLFLQDYPMNLAETASTFAECVLAEERLQQSQSPAEQLNLLDSMLADAVAFMMNIHCRFIFENAFHVERAQGEVTADRLGELMVAAQKEAYLGALADDGWNGRFWVSKLHFYITGLPFYNFPYTFGYLLSLGAYALAQGTADFPAKYRKLLIATGNSDAEAAVSSTLGYDLTQPDFWNKALDVVESRVERFLKLSE